MKKQDLINHLATAVGISKAQVGLVLTELACVAADQLGGSPGEFVLPSIGKLKRKTRSPRVGRNPQTGAPIKVPAKTVVRFSVAKALLDPLT
jgi:DNA-binding protein HU-beta